MPPALEHFCKAWKAVIGLRMATALMKWMAAAPVFWWVAEDYAEALADKGHFTPSRSSTRELSDTFAL